MTQRTDVVVVSADRGLRFHVRLVLGDVRFAVREASNADDALRLVAEDPPALVLVDGCLPADAAGSLIGAIRSRPDAGTIGTMALVPRAASPPHGHGAASILAVPTTAFALLHKVRAALEV